MILEIRVRKTVAVEDVFQRQFCVDKDLMKFVAVVSGVVHLRQLAGKHLHLQQK